MSSPRALNAVPEPPVASAVLRSSREIRALDRAAGAARAAACEGLRNCRAGVTTASVAELVREAILRAGGRPAFEGYRPPGAPSAFPGPACISVSEEALHAPPGGRTLRPGDIVTVDVGVELDGWYGDFADSVLLPGAEPHVAALLAAARSAVAVGTRACRPGVWWSSVARAVRSALAAEGLMALPGYAGHGIGRALHEQPRAAYDARAGDAGDFLLFPGMVLTLEPVVVAPPGLVEVGDDGWTVRTADGSPACHAERMVAVTRAGARILGLGRECHPAAQGL